MSAECTGSAGRALGFLGQEFARIIVFCFDVERVFKRNILRSCPVGRSSAGFRELDGYVLARAVPERLLDPEPEGGALFLEPEVAGDACIADEELFFELLLFNANDSHGLLGREDLVGQKP